MWTCWTSPGLNAINETPEPEPEPLGSGQLQDVWQKEGQPEPAGTAKPFGPAQGRPRYS